MVAHIVIYWITQREQKGEGKSEKMAPVPVCFGVNTLHNYEL